MGRGATRGRRYGARSEVEITKTTAPSGALHLALWVAQGLLAFAFLGAGSMKSFTPHADLAAQMQWVADSPAWFPRFVGGSEVLGALGLILPAALRIVPVLTPVAAALLALVMVLAMGMHLMYGEMGGLVAPLVLGGLSAFVAWGRFVAAPIPPRV